MPARREVWTYKHGVPHIDGSNVAPQAVRLDAEGDIYLASNGSLYKLDAAGNLIWDLYIDDLAYSPFIAPDGSLYAAAKHLHPVNAWMARRHSSSTRYEQDDFQFIVEISADGRELQRWRIERECWIWAGPGPDGELYGFYRIEKTAKTPRQFWLARIDLPSRQAR